MSLHCDFCLRVFKSDKALNIHKGHAHASSKGKLSRDLRNVSSSSVKSYNVNDIPRLKEFDICLERFKVVTLSQLETSLLSTSNAADVNDDVTIPSQKFIDETEESVHTNVVLNPHVGAINELSSRVQLVDTNVRTENKIQPLVHKPVSNSSTKKHGSPQLCSTEARDVMHIACELKTDENLTRSNETASSNDHGNSQNSGKPVYVKSECTSNDEVRAGIDTAKCDVDCIQPPSMKVNASPAVKNESLLDVGQLDFVVLNTSPQSIEDCAMQSECSVLNSFAGGVEDCSVSDTSARDVDGLIPESSDDVCMDTVSSCDPSQSKTKTNDLIPTVEQKGLLISCATDVTDEILLSKTSYVLIDLNNPSTIPALKQCEIKLWRIDCRYTIDGNHVFEECDELFDPSLLYACSDCGSRFKTQDLLNNHLKSIKEAEGKKLQAVTRPRLKMRPTGENGDVVTRPQLNVIRKRGRPRMVPLQKINQALDVKTEISKPLAKEKQFYEVEVMIYKPFVPNKHINRLKYGLGIKPYKCPVCNKIFIVRDVLKKHLLKHNDPSYKPKPNKSQWDERVFLCHDCGQTFTKRLNFSVHRRQHLKKKYFRKFECSICHKRFGNQLKLNIHTKIHAQQQNAAGNRLASGLSCPYCGLVLSTEISLGMHIERQHEDRRYYLCNVCDNIQTRKNDIFRHKQRDHKFGCDKCDKKFLLDYQLKFHECIYHFSENKRRACLKSYICHKNKRRFEGEKFLIVNATKVDLHPPFKGYLKAKDSTVNLRNVQGYPAKSYLVQGCNVSSVSSSAIENNLDMRDHVSSAASAIDYDIGSECMQQEFSDDAELVHSDTFVTCCNGTIVEISGTLCDTSEQQFDSASACSDAYGQAYTDMTSPRKDSSFVIPSSCGSFNGSAPYNPQLNSRSEHMTMSNQQPSVVNNNSEYQHLFAKTVEMIRALSESCQTTTVMTTTSQHVMSNNEDVKLNSEVGLVNSEVGLVNGDVHLVNGDDEQLNCEHNFKSEPSHYSEVCVSQEKVYVKQSLAVSHPPPLTHLSPVTPPAPLTHLPHHTHPLSVPDLPPTMHSFTETTPSSVTHSTVITYPTSPTVCPPVTYPPLLSHPLTDPPPLVLPRRYSNHIMLNSSEHVDSVSDDFPTEFDDRIIGNSDQFTVNAVLNSPITDGGYPNSYEENCYTQFFPVAYSDAEYDSSGVNSDNTTNKVRVPVEMMVSSWTQVSPKETKFTTDHCDVGNESS